MSLCRSDGREGVLKSGDGRGTISRSGGGVAGAEEEEEEEEEAAAAAEAEAGEKERSGRWT